MKRTLIGIMIVLFISCGNYQPPLNTRAYPPEKETRIGRIIEIVKSTDLKSISINGNVGIRKVSENERREQLKALLKGEEATKIPYLNVLDESLILNKKERKELVEDLEGFEVANLRTYKYHKYTSDYCNSDESVIIERWTVKEKYSKTKDLIRIKIYHWLKRVKRVNYYQKYIKVSKRSIPNTLEIFQNEGETLASFKIKEKSIKVLPSGRKHSVIYLGKNKFNKETNERIKQQFFEMISSCE